MSYEEIKAINWSSLKHMATSPLLYKYRLEHPEPRKPAFTFGGAVHTLVLEPEHFDERYAVYDGKRDARVKEWQAWQAEHPGVETFKQWELDRIKSMATAVLADKTAGQYVRGGRREEVVTWTDEATGLACKGRLDYIRPETFLEFKTAHDPAPRKFERDAFEFGYVAQTAFYFDGAIAARLIDGRELPIVVAAGKGAPHHVVTFRLKQETLEMGRAQYRALLRKLIACTEADYWPGIAPGLQELGLPPWANADQLFSAEAEDAEVF
jgi:PDDEXK-like uncharacterized protein DUF3799